MNFFTTPPPGRHSTVDTHGRPVVIGHPGAAGPVRSAVMAQPVGIVLVSHSATLADGVRELVAQVAGVDVRVEVAGGTVGGALGTSEELIHAAIGRADQGGGVVLLTDLGSAVLTTQVVLLDLDRADLVLVDAPFVEGAVAATVLAGVGANLAEVAAAAREARDVAKF